MNLFRTNLVIYNLFIIVAGFAQVSDTSSRKTIKQLDAVEIIAARLMVFSSGNKSETLDSALLNRYSNNNLADLLANESQVFIKSYGLGSIATSSFRGAGASHTAVLWNGFNMQNSMLAQADLSLIPVNFLNEVKLQYGGAGALWGTGAVGGTIHLNNEAVFNRGLTTSANISFGSFSDRQQQIAIEMSKKKWISSLKLFNHTAKNDFSFINTAQYGKPEQKQSNAELSQYGILQENYFLINTYQKINTRFWYQFNDRNIPPSMTQNISTAKQKDELYRITSEWQRTGERAELLARMAYFSDYICFTDSSINQNSKSFSKSVITEAEGRFSILKSDRVNIGINNTYNDAIADDYINKVNQNRTALFANYKIYSSKNTWQAVISARQEYVKNKTLPFTASIGIEGKSGRLFLLKGNIAKHYRLPSFNDLYWAGQGAKGNPDLKPESGWSEELSLIHKYTYKKMDWELGATAFNRTINNWIIWLPNQYNNWTPENVLQVWSRGIEYKLNALFKAGDFKMQLSGMYNYILSTNEKSTTPNDVSLNKQLIYVPIQNSQGSFSISYKGTLFTYTQVYTGYRYTTSDNARYLKPYTIGNIHLAQHITYNKVSLKIYIQLNNIWNEAYQVIAYRAMPLLNYQLGLSCYFNQPNKPLTINQ